MRENASRSSGSTSLKNNLAVIVVVVIVAFVQRIVAVAS